MQNRTNSSLFQHTIPSRSRRMLAAACGLLILGSTAVVQAEPSAGRPGPQSEGRENRRGERPERGERPARGEGEQGKVQRDGRPQGPGHRGMLLRQVGQIVRSLELDDAQRRTIGAILEDARDQARQLIQENADPADMRNAMLQLYRNVKADVEAELTDTQRASFQEQMAEIEKQATADNPTGSRQGPGVAIVDRLRTGVEKLDLSADQQPKVKALFDDLRVKVQAMIEKARESETDPEIIRGEVRAILEDGRAQLAEILTPEQLGQLREHMSQGQGRERAESRERGSRDGELGPREGKRGPREGERGPREGERGPREGKRGPRD